MVDRCICFNRTFAELRSVMREKEVKTVQELKAAVKFGENCKRCMPYIERMIKTGETHFTVMPFVEETPLKNGEPKPAEEAVKKASM
ncbi:MAG: (2Fe-2S)-binding protein [Rhizobacter sp.]|nr:(2Fe-2S)-binding protein [Chlorobiales bacterium]